jgi:hypothetical protein
VAVRGREAERKRASREENSKFLYIHKPGKDSMGRSFFGLAGPQPINRGRPYKRPTSENGGILILGSHLRKSILRGG